MEKQVTQNKSQAGFSLIELLVVVAIIGVLAAAGVVGYTSYLNGVKKDTHKNNAIALSKALNTTGVARLGGLNVDPTECGATPAPRATPIAGLDAAALTTAGPALGCAKAVAFDGKFKSPINTALSGLTYVEEGSTCTSPTTPNPNIGKLLVSSTPAGATPGSATVTITACDADGNAIDPTGIPTAKF